MRVLQTSLAVAVVLLIGSQAIAVTTESQAAALLSWYLIYALLVLVPLTLFKVALERYDPTNASPKDASD